MLKTSLLGLNGQLSIRSPKSVHTCSTEDNQSPIPRLSRRRRNGGFTLLEVLIATAVTMLMMLGLAQIFRVLGESMSQGRAGLELNNRLRSVMHRIRTDLDNVTVNPRPPITVGSAQGYLKYYEGPASDYTFSLIPPLNPDTGTNELLSRLGDVDDIFMATVKAKDTWFTGKVPRFVAERRPPTSFAEMGDLVTISSQFAEVVIYAQPLVAADKPGYPSNPNREPSFLAQNPDSFEDIDGNGVPDAFRLHYRTLLIRPDLNLDTGVLPNLSGANVMVAQQQSIVTASGTTSLSTPECDMSTIFQFCDLSVRRISHTMSPSTVAANTLEDLANPANRFAHVIHAVPNQNAITMPVLALWKAYVAFQGIDPDVAGSGVLHPAYALRGDRAGEDVLTTDLLAFDVKAFDSSAPVICFVGTDGEPGVAMFNDDQNSFTDRLGNGALDLGELGAVNSDDVMLKPGDPGFRDFGLINLTSSPIRSAVVAHGEYVDLNWAGKLNFFGYASELSGVRSNGFPTEAFFRSGLVKVINNPPTPLQLQFQIFQPAYDTYNNLYESDGVLQAQIAGQAGLVTIPPGSNASLAEPWRATAFDAGTDGVDNAGSAPGVDDPSEQETSPPFPVDLRGLQISVRLEDPTKKQFKQMSTVKQFVTN